MSPKVKRLLIRGHELTEAHPGIWRIEPGGRRRVGVHFVASPAILEALGDDKSMEQALNVATLPGAIDPVLAMPDIHQGYGFPIGGVAAFNTKTGVVSPGGVGYDINCGVRLLTTALTREQVTPSLKKLVSDLFSNIPAGVGGQRGDLSLTPAHFESVLANGASAAIAAGFGETADLDSIEERGKISTANPDKTSARAKERGFHQLGTLGSGNHFVEIQYVDEVYDKKTAQAFGLFTGQVVITIHTGSRGLGYQVCADYLDEAIRASAKYGIELPDRELASAPIDSPEGRDYLGAMGAAANFAFANRQIITHWVRETFSQHFGPAPIGVLYDVCHNIAKLEEMPVAGKQLTVCVHRKGATRAYPPRHAQTPPRYRDVGQPVIVPGDMGRYSFVLSGRKESMELSFGSACHGAGRELSRAKAKKLGKGRSLLHELEAKGIHVKAAGRNTVLEEMPEAYKDVAEVAQATVDASIANLVARLRPMGVVKG